MAAGHAPIKSCTRLTHGEYRKEGGQIIAKAGLLTTKRPPVRSWVTPPLRLLTIISVRSPDVLCGGERGQDRQRQYLWRGKVQEETAQEESNGGMDEVLQGGGQPDLRRRAHRAHADRPLQRNPVEEECQRHRCACHQRDRFMDDDGQLPGEQSQEEAEQRSENDRVEQWREPCTHAPGTR